MQVVSFEFKSIIGRDRTDDFEGCTPRCSCCIIPDQAGLGMLNRIEVFHKTSRFAVRSWALRIGMLP